MAVIGFHKLEGLFREGASLDIKKGHTKDILNIVEAKLYDLLIMGQANAKYNDRDVIWKSDLPITKGLEETIDQFKKLEQQIEVKDILDTLATYPPLYELEVELENSLVEIVGGLILALAKVMKTLNNDKRDISHELIQKSKQILDITL